MSSKKVSSSGVVTLCLTIEENAYLYSFLMMELKRITDDLTYFEEHPDPILQKQLVHDGKVLRDLIHLVGGGRE